MKKVVIGELSLFEIINSFLRAKTSLSSLQSQCNPCSHLCSTGSFVTCCTRSISRMKHRKLLQKMGAERVWWTASSVHRCHLRNGCRNSLCSLRKRRMRRAMSSDVWRGDEISSEYRAKGAEELASKGRRYGGLCPPILRNGLLPVKLPELLEEGICPFGGLSPWGGG